MVQLRSYSIKWKRNMFTIELLCLAPHGQERVIKLQLPPPMVEALASSLKKAVDRKKNRTSAEDDLRYLG